MIYLMTDSAERDATPTVYHHKDGTFTLNRKDGPRITPDDVYACLRTYERFGRVRLVSNPLTQLADWNPILNEGGKAGAADYQIGEFVKRRSDFWNKHIQPTIDRVTSVF
jgi:hypothetical protein